MAAFDELWKVFLESLAKGESESFLAETITESVTDILKDSVKEVLEDSGVKELQNSAREFQRFAGIGKFQNKAMRASGRAQKKIWTRQRQDWLNNEGWKHDWRSQPRNIIGEWIPGRLSYPLAIMPKVSRRVKKIRKTRRANRKIGRNIGKLISKGYTSSWGR